MNYIGQLFEFLQKLVIWWVTVMPWQRGVHIRMGKNVKLLEEGIHLRIPFIDRVYIQTTRLRVVQAPLQTVTTKDGKTITILMCIGYVINDILLLYKTLYHAEQTLCNMMQAAVADEIYSRDLVDCIPSELESSVNHRMEGERFGLHFEYLKITGFAVVKTYRLLQDGHYLPGGLDTDLQDGQKKNY